MKNTSLTFFCENKILNAVLRERQAQAAELEIKYDVDIPNRISFIVSFFAVIRTGAVPILALPAHREATIDRGGLVKWGVAALVLELAGLLLYFMALLCSHVVAFHTEKNLKMAANGLYAHLVALQQN